MTHREEIKIIIALIIGIEGVLPNNVAVERSFGVVSKDGALKGVCCGPKKSRDRIGCPTSGESSSTPFRSDRGHPCHFKGYPSDPKERDTGNGSGEELSG